MPDINFDHPSGGACGVRSGNTLILNPLSAARRLAQTPAIPQKEQFAPQSAENQHAALIYDAYGVWRTSVILQRSCAKRAVAAANQERFVSRRKSRQAILARDVFLQMQPMLNIDWTLPCRKVIGYLPLCWSSSLRLTLFHVGIVDFAPSCAYGRDFWVVISRVWWRMKYILILLDYSIGLHRRFMIVPSGWLN